MLLIKKYWFKLLNILLLLSTFLLVGVYYNNIPVKVELGKITSGNFSFFCDSGNGFNEKNVKMVSINNQSKFKIFLPARTKNFKISANNKDEQFLTTVKIGQIFVSYKELFSDLILQNASAQLIKNDVVQIVPNSQNYSISIKSAPTAIKSRQISIIIMGIFGLFLSFLIPRLLNYCIKRKDSFFIFLDGLFQKLFEIKLNKNLFLIMGLILIFFFSLNFLIQISFLEGTGLDISWHWGLNKLNTLPQFIFGRDVVFTYGPLGFLLVPKLYGSNFIWAEMFNLFNWLTVITLLILNIFKINKDFYIGKFIFLLLGIFVLYPTTQDWILCLIFMFVVLTLWFSDEDNKIETIVLSSLVGFYSALILFVKFNSGLLAISLALLLAVSLYIYKRKSIKSFLISFAVSFLIPFFLIFNLYFKNFHNFLNWIIGSLSVAKGFNESMTVFGPVSFTVVAVFIITLYLHLLHRNFKIDRNLFVGTLLMAPFIFFNFKHGFVRQDGHMYCFFLTVPYLIGLLSFYIPQKDFKYYLKILILIVICCNLYRWPTHINKSLLTPLNQLIGLNASQKEASSLKSILLQSDVLPVNWIKIIDNDSIQILPWELYYAEANNLKGWQPSPVLQLYSAYTEYLDNLNASSFIKENAPEYILVEFLSIDNRNMFLDNPATWNNIMNNYSVCLKDKNKLLLKKNKKVTVTKFTKVKMQTAELNK